MIMFKKLYKSYKESDKAFKLGFWLFIILSLVIFSLPLLITKISWISLGDYKANEIGDTLGGIMGPFVGLLAAFLTFLAFWAQFKANQKVQEQFKKQELSSKIEFYHSLLKEAKNKISESYFTDLNRKKFNSFSGIVKQNKIIYNQIVKIDYFLFKLQNEKEFVLEPNYKNNIEYLDDYHYNYNKRKFELIELSWYYCYMGMDFNKDYEGFFINVHHNLKYNIFPKGNYKDFDYFMNNSFDTMF